jgi:hypothetical protein|eukprot:gene9504-11657_t
MLSGSNTGDMVNYTKAVSNYFMPAVKHRYFLVLFIAAITIALRRPDQISFPEVWNEDGLFIIPQVIERGFMAIFEPVNGYLILPSRLITYIALFISFEHYPVISTIIGIAAQAACVAAVAASPTYLRGRILCAVMMVILPMNAEVYALPQYTFWWTTCLLFLALIWRPGEALILRYTFILIGSLSSPTCIILLPLFALRAVLTKRWREDGLSFLLVAVGVVIQLYYVMIGDPAKTENIELADIIPAISVFFGGMSFVASTWMELSVALGTAALLLFGVLAVQSDTRFAYVLLGLALGATIGSSLLRVPIEMISPVGNGPRYFFFPLVLMSWMLVWLIFSASSIVRGVAVIVVLGWIPVTIHNFQRGQDRLEAWSEAVSRCLVEGAIMPVHHDGNTASHHQIPYSLELCQQAEANDIW